MEFFGKFRAVVTNTNDPKKMGRIKVECPTIYGKFESGWCLPNVSFAGKSRGMNFPPEIGDGVWVEFERGNTNFPIWTGCWYGENENNLENFEIKVSDDCKLTFKQGDIQITTSDEVISFKTLLTRVKALEDKAHTH